MNIICKQDHSIVWNDNNFNKHQTHLQSNSNSTLQLNPTAKMCYKVITHTVRCDVRPIISDGFYIFVDPYTTPGSCNCEAQPSIRARFSCDQHGCCIRTEKNVRCGESWNCWETEPVEFHRYRQNLNSNLSTDGSQPEVWHVVPNFDADSFYLPLDALTQHRVAAPVESALLRTARTNALNTGHAIADAIFEMGKAQKRVEKLRLRHEGNHPSCERVLNEWECAETTPIREWEGRIANWSKIVALRMGLFRSNMYLYTAIKAEEQGRPLQGMSIEELLVEELPERASMDDLPSPDGQLFIDMSNDWDEADERASEWDLDAPSVSRPRRTASKQIQAPRDAKKALCKWAKHQAQRAATRAIRYQDHRLLPGEPMLNTPSTYLVCNTEVEYSNHDDRDDEEQYEEVHGIFIGDYMSGWTVAPENVPYYRTYLKQEKKYDIPRWEAWLKVQKAPSNEVAEKLWWKGMEEKRRKCGGCGWLRENCACYVCFECYSYWSDKEETSNEEETSCEKTSTQDTSNKEDM